MRGILFVLIMHKGFYSNCSPKKLRHWQQQWLSPTQITKPNPVLKSEKSAGHKFHCLFCLSVCLLHGSIAVLLFSSMHLSYPEKAHQFLMPILKIRCLSNFAVHLGYNCFRHRYVAPWKQERQYLRDRKSWRQGDVWRWRVAVWKGVYACVLIMLSFCVSSVDAPICS